MNDALLFDIHALNARWLRLVQEAHRDDPEQALLVFGLRAETARRIASLTQAQVDLLARSDIALFRPRHDPHWWDSALHAAEQHDERAATLMHARGILTLPVERQSGRRTGDASSGSNPGRS